MARKPRILQNEFAYHVTCRTNNKAFRFKRGQHIRLFSKILSKAQEKFNIRIYHFLLMSNHYHMIIHTPDSNISAAMQYINSRIAILYNRLHQRTGHLWGARFRATIIDSEEAYLRVIRYLYQNPVRAKITLTVAQFEDSSFGFYAHGRKTEVPIDPDHLAPALGDPPTVAVKKRARFLRLVEQNPDDSATEQVRLGLRQRFFGSAEFVQRMKNRYL